VRTLSIATEILGRILHLSMFLGILHDLLRIRAFAVGLIGILALTIFSLIGGLVTSYDKTYAGAFDPQLPPNPRNPLGTDLLGRDIYAQLIYGLSNSLAIGIIAGAIGTLLGTLIGITAGYFRGFVDSVLRLFIDVNLALPSMLVLVLIASYFRGLDYIGMALIICLFNWAWPARQVRAQTLSLRERDFIYLARLSNMGRFEILVREIMPHLTPWMVANFVNATISAILTESGLSIIGLGPQRSMTLGMILHWALSYAAIYRGLWWWWATPVIFLSIIFIFLYLIYMGITRYFAEREVFA
jgi:peptide/nickel transport system permease protein